VLHILVLGALLGGCVALTWQQVLKVEDSKWLDDAGAERAQKLWEITTAVPLYFLPTCKKEGKRREGDDELCSSAVYEAWNLTHTKLCGALGSSAFDVTEDKAVTDGEDQQSSDTPTDDEVPSGAAGRAPSAVDCTRGSAAARLFVPNTPGGLSTSGYVPAIATDITTCLPATMSNPCATATGKRKQLVAVGCLLNGCHSTDYCLAAHSFAGHEVDHIVGKKSEELFKNEKKLDILGNVVMTSARWNRAVGAKSDDNAIQKILVYGKVLSVAARYWIQRCASEVPNGMTLLESKALAFAARPKNSDWRLICTTPAPSAVSVASVSSSTLPYPMTLPKSALKRASVAPKLFEGECH
jgi:hypothetical protein